MSKATNMPERIWACTSVSSKSGTVVLLGHAHFDVSGWQEYIHRAEVEAAVKRAIEACAEEVDLIHGLDLLDRDRVADTVRRIAADPEAIAKIIGDA